MTDELEDLDVEVIGDTDVTAQKIREDLGETSDRGVLDILREEDLGMFRPVSAVPQRAIPVFLLFHTVLDPATAYWMMSVRGTEKELNPLAVWLFETGPVAFGGFFAVATVLLGSFMWFFCDDMWSKNWAPIAMEFLIIAGVSVTIGNVIAALGFG